MAGVFSHIVRGAWGIAIVLSLCTHGGCASTARRDAGAVHETAGQTAGPAAPVDDVSGQVHNMAEEDARRMETAGSRPPPPRPDPIRRESRSPVDQPRLR